MCPQVKALIRGQSRQTRDERSNAIADPARAGGHVARVDDEATGVSRQCLSALNERQAPRAFEIERLAAPLVVRALRANAADGAGVSAGLLGVKLGFEIERRVLQERLLEDAASLRAPVDIAELIDVQIPASRTAFERRAATRQNP